VNLNEHRPILLAAKCGTGTLVPAIMRRVRLFAGFPGSNKNGCFSTTTDEGSACTLA